VIIGARQTFTGVTIPLTTASQVCRVTSTTGCNGVLLRLSAGNSANLLSIAFGQPVDTGATAANVTGTRLTTTDIATTKANGTSPDGGYVYLVPTNSAWSVATPNVDIWLACTVGAITGVIIHAWPIFSDTELRSVTTLSLP
jgi:hypothetical protein